jgi:FlaA1/EpsC-like NDP-sugar epimerase
MLYDEVPGTAGYMVRNKTNRIDKSKILIIGGTGSLGTTLTRRLLSGKDGNPESVTIFSRDEDKQHSMRLNYPQKKLKFIIGDVRDYDSVFDALDGIDIVFNAAAMKHVPSCEKNVEEAWKTNVEGTQNLINATKRVRRLVSSVIGVSSDKGLEPINVYGLTKALQEKIIMSGNTDCPETRFICVCYGNVMASRGSVIPVFQKQIKEGGPVTITEPNMTRFLISLDRAVDTLLAALNGADKGEIYIPIIKSARVEDIADALIGDRKTEKQIVGIREGEKMDEILITRLDAKKTVQRGEFYVVTRHNQTVPALQGEYNSSDYLMTREELVELLDCHGLLLEPEAGRMNQ